MRMFKVALGIIALLKEMLVPLAVPAPVSLNLPPPPAPSPPPCLQVLGAAVPPAESRIRASFHDRRFLPAPSALTPAQPWKGLGLGQLRLSRARVAQTCI